MNERAPVPMSKEPKEYVNDNSERGEVEAVLRRVLSPDAITLLDSLYLATDYQAVDRILHTLNMLGPAQLNRQDPTVAGEIENERLAEREMSGVLEIQGYRIHVVRAKNGLFTFTRL